jgi:hypothetical protein
VPASHICNDGKTLAALRIAQQPELRIPLAGAAPPLLGADPAAVPGAVPQSFITLSLYQLITANVPRTGHFEFSILHSAAHTAIGAPTPTIRHFWLKLLADR